MKPRRLMTALTATAAMLALAACGGGGDSEADTNGEAAQEGGMTDLILATGGTAGVYYPFGGELATLYENEIDGISVNYVESGGSAENVGQIYQEEWQIGFSDNGTAELAVRGELPGLEGEELDNLGWIGNLYPEALHVIVREDSDYESIADLEGATIAVGDAGSGTRITSDKVLDAYGLTEEDYEPEVTDFGSSTEMLADGQIDATMFVVGTPVAGLTQLSATTDVRLLPVDDDVASEVEEAGSETAYDIPADVYDFLEEDVQTVAVFASLIASTTQVSEDVGYEITKATFENADSITVEAAQFVDIDEALLGIGEIPLHPGAARYFEEVGLDLP
ncbi:MAG TPA: TAXI family TRAP transporter solute-binding subunit [Yaniella sp.]